MEVESYWSVNYFSKSFLERCLSIVTLTRSRSVGGSSATTLEPPVRVTVGLTVDTNSNLISLRFIISYHWIISESLSCNDHLSTMKEERKKKLPSNSSTYTWFESTIWDIYMKRFRLSSPGRSCKFYLAGHRFDSPNLSRKIVISHPTGLIPLDQLRWTDTLKDVDRHRRPSHRCNCPIFDDDDGGRSTTTGLRHVEETKIQEK